MKVYNLAIFLMALVTLGLWIASKESISSIGLDPLHSLTQITALLGVTCYFVSFILSSRLPFFESTLPLDKSYRIHRLVGTLAGSGIILHVSTLITALLPSTVGLTLYLVPLLPSKLLAYNLGIFGFYLMIITVLSSIYMKLPYQQWKLIHKLTSYSILFSVLHIFLITSDVSRFLPLKLWILGLGFLAFLSWIYSQYIYSRFAYSHKYKVSNVLTLNQVTVITLSSVENPLKINPGQFAFFKVVTSAKQLPNESHPYTILASSHDRLVVAIKHLGDYTNTLSLLVEGDEVRVAGPHGSFGTDFLHSSKPSVWIAGGIGVTPFFNLLAYLAQYKEKKNMNFYYTTSDQDNLFHPQILTYSKEIGFPYTYVQSNTDGRLTSDMVVKGLKEPLQNYNYFLCGPKGLLLSMMTELEKNDVPRSNIFVEDFDFKDLEV